jgi:V/A-type H+-transporting ATPase subunit I
MLTLRADMAALEPFGDFDPGELDRLREQGIAVRLFHSPSRKPLAAPEGCSLTVLRSDASGQYVAVAGTGAFTFEGREFMPPRHSLSRLTADWQEAAGDSRRAAMQLAELAEDRDDLLALIEQARSNLRMAEARTGMGEDARVAYLQGYVPVNALDRLRAAARKQGWGLLVQDPADSDTVPTLIRNPAWIRPIEPLLSFLGILPGYREIDAGAAFLVFLSIFFAMIVGDAGYGLLFLPLVAWARRKAPKAPPEPFRLLYLFSGATVVWGILSGNYFGIGNLPAPLRWLRVDWLLDRDNSMSFCLLLGAIHLSVAHGWSALSLGRKPQALAQLGWIGMTWTMYVTARKLLLGAAFPTWFVPVPVASVLLIALFMTPLRKLKQEWTGHALLLLNIISNFGDVVSYLRLFALGVAGIKVAEAFNEMALMVGFGNVGRGLGAAVILLFGHSLNIVLCAMSVLVHGVRLNALEFSLHMGLEWSGVRYRPFTRGAEDAPETLAPGEAVTG